MKFVSMVLVAMAASSAMASAPNVTATGEISAAGYACVAKKMVEVSSVQSYASATPEEINGYIQVEEQYANWVVKAALSKCGIK